MLTYINIVKFVGMALAAKYSDELIAEYVQAALEAEDTTVFLKMTPEERYKDFKIYINFVV